MNKKYQSMKDKLDELQDAAEAMVRLLKDRQEGLGTWWSMLRMASDRLHESLPPKSTEKF